jgi:hypothetical protein
MAAGGRPDLLAEHVSRPGSPVGPGAVTLLRHVPRPGGIAEGRRAPECASSGLIRALRPELVPGHTLGLLPR